MCQKNKIQRVSVTKGTKITGIYSIAFVFFAFFVLFVVYWNRSRAAMRASIGGCVEKNTIQPRAPLIFSVASA